MDKDERRGATITRVIGCLAFYADDSTEFVGSTFVDLAIGVASQEAFALGVTAISDPRDATAQPVGGWIYRCRQLITTGASTINPSPLVRWQFDVKSQRKIDTGEPYIVWGDTVATGTGSPGTIVGSVRTLLRLS